MHDRPASEHASTAPRQMPNYCYCSELSHREILERQQSNPLSFEEATQVYCNSWEGCGRCLWFLEQLFRAEKCYVE